MSQMPEFQGMSPREMVRLHWDPRVRFLALGGFSSLQGLGKACGAAWAHQGPQWPLSEGQIRPGPSQSNSLSRGPMRVSQPEARKAWVTTVT